MLLVPVGLSHPLHPSGSRQPLEGPSAPTEGGQEPLHTPLRQTITMPRLGSDLRQCGSLPVSPRDMSNSMGSTKVWAPQDHWSAPRSGNNPCSSLLLTVIQMVPQQFSFPQIFPSMVLKAAKHQPRLHPKSHPLPCRQMGNKYWHHWKMLPTPHLQRAQADNSPHIRSHPTGEGYLDLTGGKQNWGV